MKELAFFVAREKVRQPMVVAIVLAVLALAVVWAVYAGNPGGVLSFGGVLLGITLGFGLVGQDFLHGSLQLLLARPITRNGYLAGKLLGAFFAGAGALLATGGAVAVVLVFKGRVGSWETWLRGWWPGFYGWLGSWCCLPQGGCSARAIAAAMRLFSSWCSFCPCC